MSGTRVENVFMAEMAEKCGRYEDMTTYMSRVVEQGDPLNEEERAKLHTAFKQAISGPRAAYKKVKLERERGEVQSEEIQMEYQNYQTSIVSRVQEHANKILSLLEEKLLPGSSAETDAEGQVFYLKMQGDYTRYLAEVTEDPGGLEEVKSRALTAYLQGLQVAESYLLPWNDTRLSLALNLSVTYYENYNDKEKAVEVSRKAREGVPEENRLRSAQVDQICTLLDENMVMWANNPSNENDGTTVCDF